MSATRDFLDSIFTLRELLFLTDNEMVQLEEVRGDAALVAQWWRRRRAREAEWFGFYCRMAENHRALSEDYQRRAEALCSEADEPKGAA